MSALPKCRFSLINAGYNLSNHTTVRYSMLVSEPHNNVICKEAQGLNEALSLLERPYPILESDLFHPW